MEDMSYDIILKEARMLRENLEAEYNMNHGFKEEIENLITETRPKIADAQASKPSDHIYDDILILLSQELTDFEKNIQEIEARMQPLDNTIGDIKHVEGLIKDRELDSQQASMLLETIAKKIFDDLSVSGHGLSGDAHCAVDGGPRNFLDELQGKMHNAALSHSDLERSNCPKTVLGWTASTSNGENTRISESRISEKAIEKKIRSAREASQRSSANNHEGRERLKQRHNSSFLRAAAFRFNAVNRADAFRHVNYIPPAGPPIREDTTE